jgi:outer membrane protein OmpA-like peptidoglycan-associated protein
MRRILLSGVALISLLSASAYADSATTDVNSMVDQLAPKADAAPPSSAVLTVQTATEINVVERLQVSASRAVGGAAQAVRLPSPERGHELEILRSLAGRPAIEVAVNFQGGSDALAQESIEFLGNLAAALNNPKLAAQRFLIGVHTDLVGSDEYNLDLAGLRARAIAGALSQQFGVPSARLEPVGFGRVQGDEGSLGSQIRVVNLGDFAPAPAVAAPVAPVAKIVRPARPHVASTTPWNAHRAKHVVRAHAVTVAGPAYRRSNFAAAAPAPAYDPPPDEAPVFLGAPSHIGGGGGGGGGGSGGGGWSDRRLKRNIVRVGQSASGLPLYRFQYIWGGPEFVGVMAQDLITLRPDALILDDSGYFRVDYDKLGFPMRTLEDYEARLALTM